MKAIGDLDADGIEEVALTIRDGNYYKGFAILFLNSTGAVETGFSVTTGLRTWPVDIGQYGSFGLDICSMGDWDGDGLPELAVLGNARVQIMYPSFRTDLPDAVGPGSWSGVSASPSPSPTPSITPSISVTPSITPSISVTPSISSTPRPPPPVRNDDFNPNPQGDDFNPNPQGDDFNPQDDDMSGGPPTRPQIDEVLLERAPSAFEPVALSSGRSGNAGPSTVFPGSTPGDNLGAAMVTIDGEDGEGGPIWGFVSGAPGAEGGKGAIHEVEFIRAADGSITMNGTMRTWEDLFGSTSGLQLVGESLAPLGVLSTGDATPDLLVSGQPVGDPNHRFYVVNRKTDGSVEVQGSFGAADLLGSSPSPGTSTPYRYVTVRPATGAINRVTYLAGTTLNTLWIVPVTAPSGGPSLTAAVVSQADVQTIDTTTEQQLLDIIPANGGPFTLFG